MPTPCASTSIDSLWIYPVKSLAGIRLQQCELTPHGLKGDRQWMIIDDKGGFVSQRKLPKMGLVKTALSNNQELTLSFDKTSISIHPEDCTIPCDTKIWTDECSALQAPKHANDWLNRQLNYKKTLRLVHFNPATRRKANTARFGDNTTFFADAAPFLICNSASLDALNIELKSKSSPTVTMARFRPNIVIATANAFDEHHYTRAGHPNFQLNLIDHCQRCSIITLNPQTALSQDAGILFDSLSRLNPMPNNPKAPAFGVNCTSNVTGLATPTLISEGMPITLSP